MPKPGERGLTPYWRTTDGKTVRLYLGDVVDILGRLPAGSVQCVVTSPPYWGLRDYSACACRVVKVGGTRGASGSVSTPGQSGAVQVRPNADPRCLSCSGSGRVIGMERQIGSEGSPEEYVERLTMVFRAVRRVLRDDGTLWLNLGDSYSAGGQLVGVPWRVALALQADGWVLRQDIVWSKPSPMPESVRNRCTKAHEYVFLFAKRADYFCDMEAIKEKASETGGGWQSRGRAGKLKPHGDSETCQDGDVEGLGPTPAPTGFANKRSVWTVPGAGYPGAHFATFPPNLIRPMILAGTSERGCCGRCGAPWRRVVESGEYTNIDTNRTKRKAGSPHEQGQSADGGDSGINPRGGGYWPTKTVGWEPTCGCVECCSCGVAYSVRCGCGAGWGPPATVPCVVLDPFVGAGTTVVVCLEEGRRSVGIDLSEAYIKENAVPRVEGVLLGRPAWRGLVPVREGPGTDTSLPVLPGRRAASRPREPE